MSDKHIGQNAVRMGGIRLEYIHGEYSGYWNLFLCPIVICIQLPLRLGDDPGFGSFSGDQVFRDNRE